MQIRHNKLDIPKDDPFKYDALKRSDLEPPLTQFVTQASGSFVLALDASWGAGKTTFLEMWKVKLTEAGHVCLYLNAWQTDFAKEPLIAIVGELKKAIEEFANQSGEAGNSLKKQMKKTQQLVESLLKHLLLLGIKVGTHGILDIKESAIEKAIVDSVSSGTEDLLKSYEKSKSEIKEFKEILTSLVSEVASLNHSAKVVIIIDELDRCRPIYAVELLERVKHLFDASGVVFILGIDRSQLHHSIRSLYGSEFDATGYLRRFIDLDYQLPEPKVGDYCNFLFERFGIQELIAKRQSKDDLNEINNLKKHLGGLMSAARMSLRTQEQTIARLRIVLQTIPRGEMIYEKILSLLLFLREWGYTIYLDVSEGKIDLDNLLPQIESLPSIQKASKNFINMELIEAYFLAILTELKSEPPRLEHYKKLAESNSERDSHEFKKVQQIVNTYNGFFQDYPYNSVGFKITVERLALANNFVLYEE